MSYSLFKNLPKPLYAEILGLSRWHIDEKSWSVAVIVCPFSLERSPYFAVRLITSWLKRNHSCDKKRIAHWISGLSCWFVEITGLEPATFRLRTWRSTRWAKSPASTCSVTCFDMLSNLSGCKSKKIRNVECGIRNIFNYECVIRNAECGIIFTFADF